MVKHWSSPQGLTPRPRLRHASRKTRQQCVVEEEERRPNGPARPWRTLWPSDLATRSVKLKGPLRPALESIEVWKISALPEQSC